MDITKAIILEELKKDGSLKNKTYLTKFKTPEELYNIYNEGISNKCSICNKPTRFLNFKRGYDEVCSRECRKKLAAKKFVYDENNITDIETLKEFIRCEYNTNVANKLNISFFINNNYIKELNTVIKYLKSINENIEDLTIKHFHDIIYGVGICSKCGAETTFNGFGNPYRKTCKIKCSKTIHIENEENLNKNYIINNFIKNNQFLIKKMIDYFKCSESFVNKYKFKNNINVNNQQEKYSFGERILFNKYKHLNIKTNCRTIITPYELDFVIENIAIEFDGLLFHSKGNGYPYDCSKRHKDKLLPSNMQLLTIFEDEFLDTDKQKIWLSLIDNKIGLSTKIHARKCIIKEVSTIEAREFCVGNHLQGYAKSSCRVGLYYNEELISLMTFRKHKKYQWEIARFCSKLNISIIGGASKLLKYFERNYNPKSVMSYANKRWSNGKLYESIGFEYIEDTPHNYFYFKINENILYPREKFQKHKLKDILETFDASLSEEQNMFNNNYRKIYDYGNKKYVKYYI